MSVIATACRHLMAAGVTGDALLAAIADMEADLAALGVAGGAAGGRIYSMSKGAIRTRRWRDRKAASQASQSVTYVTDVTPGDAGAAVPAEAVTGAENPRNGGVSLVPGRGQMWAVHDGGGQGPVTSVTPGDAKENSPQTPHKENIYSGGQGWARAPACEGAPGDGGGLPDRRRAKRKARRRAGGSGDTLPHIGLAGDALPESFDKPGEAQFCAIVRRAMASAMGAGTYRAWLDPCRIAIHDGWISIFPPSPVIGDWLGNNHIDRMRLVARRFNLKVEIRRDEAGRRRAASAG